MSVVIEVSGKLYACKTGRNSPGEKLIYLAKDYRMSKQCKFFVGEIYLPMSYAGRKFKIRLEEVASDDA